MMRFDTRLAQDQPLWMVFHQNSRWRPTEWAEVRRRASGRVRAEQPGPWGFRRRPFLTLPEPPDGNGLSASLGQTLLTRRSARGFAGLPLRWEETSAILWATAGLIPAEDSGHRRRTVPSAGARYPLETFFWLPTPPDGRGHGPYHYDPSRHGAAELLPEPAMPLSGLLAACAYPALVERAGLLIVLAAVFERTTEVYGARGYRFVLIEAGHMAQNAYLAGAALGLGAVALGGWDDAALDAALGLDGVHASALYAVALGRTINGG
jgi:SagB-type dehydrogenase family enzyme